jgi:hypothetical protein
MSLDLALITELDAVNAMLELLGSSPVNSLPDSGVSEAYIARNILHRTSRKVQHNNGSGLSFNKDVKYSMSPNGSGHIIAPSNALSLDAYYHYQPFVLRYDVNDSKLKLYDQENHTFVFTSAVYCNIVWFFAWAGLPNHARELIYVLAGRDFQKKFQSSELIHQLTDEDEARARADFWDAEYRISDDSILCSAGAFEIVNRRV